MKEFNKVIGYKDVKIELERIIDMMTNPKKYDDLGVTTTRGLLLHGKPGVGKTLMAKCFLEASKRKTYIVRKNMPDGDFVKLIKDTFTEAKNNAPSVVLLDDIDKFANEDEDHINAEEFVTIQSCIDDCKGEEVFVIATANSLRCLPRSLLREGRFDKNIKIENPTGKDAEEIIKFYLSKKKVAKDVDTKEVTRLLDGGSCAGLETVINEAGVYAAYENKKAIDMQDLIRAFMRVVYQAPEALSEEESKYIKNTAAHEAGHTVANEVLEPESVNIVSVKKHDGSVGGFTSYEQDKDYFCSKHFMENRVISLLAGKAASELVFGVTDVGCNDDLHRAFSIVSRFVDDYCGYGFNFWEGATDCGSSNALLERKEQLIQTEMQRYYQKALKILVENRKFLDKLTDELVKKKVLTYNDIQRIKKSCE